MNNTIINAQRSIRFEMNIECAGKPDSVRIDWLVNRLAHWISNSTDDDYSRDRDAALSDEARFEESQR